MWRGLICILCLVRHMEMSLFKVVFVNVPVKNAKMLDFEQEE